MGWIDDASRRIEVEGQSTRLYEAGEGPPAVVLHGWGGRIESMAPVLACLRDRRRVISLDLPGFGEAPIPKETWGTPQYARFVSATLGQAGVDAADFVGHSYGAKTSLFLAATQPHLVKSLVLVGSSGLRTPPSVKARVKRGISRGARFAGRLGSGGRKLREAVYARIASDDYKQAGHLRPILVKVVNEDLSELLPGIAVPTLLVWGTEDEAVPVSHAKKMEESIPDAGLVLFEGAGHFAYLDEQERFCRILREFLK